MCAFAATTRNMTPPYVSIGTCLALNKAEPTTAPCGNY